MQSFDWDEENIAHIARHNIMPDEVEFALLGPALDVGYEWRKGEERFSEIGATATGRFLYIVSTPRGERVRVVTAYDAPKELISEYLRRR